MSQRGYIPPKPGGNSPKKMAHRWIHDCLAGGKFPIKGDGDVIIQWSQGVYRVSVKPRRGGGGSIAGLQFQQPDVELDITIAVPAQTIVSISPSNPIATTGYFDLVTGTMTNAPTGYWVSKVNIPAAAVNPAGKPAGTYYNVPVMPPQVAWVSSPGSQKGDLDQPGILWWPLPRTGSCV